MYINCFTFPSKSGLWYRYCTKGCVVIWWFWIPFFSADFSGTSCDCGCCMTCLDSFLFRNLANILSLKWLRSGFIWRALLSWLHRFLANRYLGLNYVFSVQVWFICLNVIDLSKKSTFCLFKAEFKAKKPFARNRCSQLRRAVHIKPDL